MNDKTCTIILVSPGSQVQVYGADTETMARVWDMLNNLHDLTPLRLPESNSELVAGAGKEVQQHSLEKTVEPQPAPLQVVRQTKPPRPTVQESARDDGDAAFLSSLSGLMSKQR
jgi:hypothetical protein